MRRSHELPKKFLWFSAFLVLGSAAITAFRPHNIKPDDQKMPWQIPATAPLLTPWAKQISPQQVHPEYPRPQLVRREWKNLNGLWEYAEAMINENPPVGKKLAGSILVPFPIESALSGVMKSTERLWYRCIFTLPPSWREQHVLLHFGAADWEATVYVNGKFIGQHHGGYDSFSFDITAALQREGSHELIVGVFDPSDAGEQPRGKQVREPKGIWYTPTTGIWQTVWLEPVPETHIRELIITPDVDANALRLTVLTSTSQAQDEIRVQVLDAGKTVATVSGKAGSEMIIPLRSPQLWSPSHPFLYDLNINLVHDGKKLDAVTSYLGMRKIAIAKDAAGINRVMLNGKFVMQVGPLDQGFWPDGLYTAPTDAALRYDLEVTKQLGFNMTRKHVKVEPERWYYWADKLGVLVWQDMPSGNNQTPESKMQFERELEQLIRLHRNHPAIIMWVVFNEGWGQYDTERLTAWVEQLDPTRLVNNASGWADKNVGAVNDIHSYPKPKSPKAEPDRAIVLGEFGGLGLAIPGHTWKKEHWGYQGMADAEQLTSKYESFLRTVYQLKDDPGLSAAVYTQITDVEVECNGLLTYDRAVIKPDRQRIAAANQGDFSQLPPPPIVQVIIPTSEQQGQEWRYTMEKPSDDWFKPDFDAAHWQIGRAGFGRHDTPGAVMRTKWISSDIWLRREITMPDRKYTALSFRIHHDEDAEIYINGVLAGKFTEWTTDYEEAPITSEGKAAIKAGKNILALHCRQTGGGQYIDVGIVDIIPVQFKKE
jgi:hypothetical protein